jgi:hypothetical protein
MADKKLTEVSIVYGDNSRSKGLIYIHADRVIDLDKVVRKISTEGIEGAMFSTAQIYDLDKYIFPVSQVSGLEDKLEEAKTDWIII